jgi:hypothetical protein
MSSQENYQLKENIESEAIKGLENFSKISPRDKMLILAVYLDLKPMSILNLSSHDTDQIESEIMPIIQNMNMFGKISHDVHKDKIHNFEMPMTNLFVSKDEESLKNMSMGDNDYSELGFEGYHRKYGKNFGYPQTAVEGFVKGNLLGLGLKDLPKEITDEDKKFMFFGLSKDNWKEEIDLVRKIEMKIKALSPTIYQEIMNRKID